MPFQSLIQAADDGSLKVVFPFGGQVHEVHVLRYQPGSGAAVVTVRETAASVLASLLSRAALEVQQALAAAGPAHVPCIDVPSAASELRGSFSDLVQQLQECVDEGRPIEMAWQGMIQEVDRGRLKVAFPFGGQVHEVHVPCLSERPWLLRKAREDATTVLACFTLRATLEMQQAFARACPLHKPLMDVPAFASELRGSFADLTRQLQLCLDGAGHPGYTAATHMLMAAAQLDLVSAVQQLLLISPQGGWDVGAADQNPAFLAARSRHGAAVLQLLLAAAPEQVHMRCEGDTDLDETLMHAAARAGNVDALRLLLQLAPGLATATTDYYAHTPLHRAACSGGSEAAQLLLAASPQTASTHGIFQQLPMHRAADSGRADSLQALLDAGAPGIDQPDAHGHLPLHLAAGSGSRAAVCLLLAAHPAAALAEDRQGQRPLLLALESLIQQPHINPDAARILLHVSGMSTQQLLGLFAAVPPAAQPLVQPLYADDAAHLPLSRAQWERVPAPCLGLGSALTAVLARSGAEAALLVAHLPPADHERLRAAALSLHRVQRTLGVDVPAALLGRILVLSLSDL